MPAGSLSGAQAVRQIADAGGLGAAFVTLADDDVPVIEPWAAGIVRVGVHRRGPLPSQGLDAFDVLLTTAEDAGAPWVRVEPLDPAVAQLRETIERQPVAAAVAAQVLRMTLKLSFEESLALESIGYSMLLASEGFKAWRAATPVRTRADDDQPRVEVARHAGVIDVRLTRPAARNAVDARMRDALVEALESAGFDPDGTPVMLSGEGLAFSAGGDLDEFGKADDPGRAHAIRVLRSATGLVFKLAGRVTARLHGACVGAGIEMPAAAGRIVARPGTVFRLPEVSMGLIPGAGGTASIPRRVGRQRACYMAISGQELDVATAQAWGLVDAVEPPP